MLVVTSSLGYAKQRAPEFRSVGAGLSMTFSEIVRLKEHAMGPQGWRRNSSSKILSALQTNNEEGGGGGGPLQEQLHVAARTNARWSYIELRGKADKVGGRNSFFFLFFFRKWEEEGRKAS